jgi:hypothetical protein
VVGWVVERGAEAVGRGGRQWDMVGGSGMLWDVVGGRKIGDVATQSINKQRC